MRLNRLGFENIRGFERAEIEPGPGLNLLLGGNGAGKTTILEAVHVLGYGRSFRGSLRDGVIRRGCTSLRISASLQTALGSRQIGFERAGSEWAARIDGRAVSTLGDLHRSIAVVTVEPGSHQLIDGGSDLRRRFVDWALFHVEPEFLGIWRRYHRALKQRNSVLKTGHPEVSLLDAWEREMDAAGVALDALRRSLLAQLQPAMQRLCNLFLPEAGAIGIRYVPGWSHGAATLAEALCASRGRDQGLGHTSHGPHRADWSVGFEQLPGRETFSRGQCKLVALACLLAQAELLSTMRQEWPILCLDDLVSELDTEHLGRCVAYLARTPAQVLFASTSAPGDLPTWCGGVSTFHVERGRVSPLV